MVANMSESFNNNLGVDRLAKRDFRGAVQCFKSALTRTVDDLQHQPADEDKEGESMGQIEMCQDRLPQQVSTTDTLLSREAEHYMDQEDVSYSFLNGIPITPSPGAFHQEDPVLDASITVAIIILNLGISYHMWSTMESKSKRARLEKALCLYNKSLLLLGDVGATERCTGHPLIDLAVMALMNNMAQIFLELSLHIDARSYLDDLTFFAHTVSPVVYGDATVAAMMEERRASFLTIAMLFSKPTIAEAA